MKVFEHRDEQGALVCFEIRSLWPRWVAYRAIRAIPGVEVIKSLRSFSTENQDIFCVFKVGQTVLEIEEPFGDSNRFLVASNPAAPSKELEQVKDHFQVYIHMGNEKLIRKALFTTAIFNFGAALAFAFPLSVGQLISLPAAPPVYSALCAAFIALFGGSYAWLAMQSTISRPMLAFGAIGKTAAFVIFFTLWLYGHASFLLMLGGVGDLAFAAFFFSWLRVSAAEQGAPADIHASRGRG